MWAERYHKWVFKWERERDEQYQHMRLDTRYLPSVPRAKKLILDITYVLTYLLRWGSCRHFCWIGWWRNRRFLARTSWRRLTRIGCGLSYVDGVEWETEQAYRVIEWKTNSITSDSVKEYAYCCKTSLPLLTAIQSGQTMGWMRAKRTALCLGFLKAIDLDSMRAVGHMNDWWREKLISRLSEKVF